MKLVTMIMKHYLCMGPSITKDCSSRSTRGGSGLLMDVFQCHKLQTEAENLKERGCIASYGRNQIGGILEEKDGKWGWGFRVQSRSCQD